MDNNMEKSATGLLAFLVGGLIGVTVGILFAPRAGKETRHIMTEEVEDMIDTAVSSIHDAQEAALSALKDTQTRMERLSEETQDRLGKLQDIAEKTLNDQKKSLKKGYSNVKSVITD
jgi:gas vesicle protein